MDDLLRRYLLYGDVSHRAAVMLRDDVVRDFFIRLIQRVSPKSYAQAEAEVRVSRIFLENFSFRQRNEMPNGDAIPWKE